MKTHENRPQQLNKQPASAGTLGEKGTLPAQHTTFNTLDNWAIKTPPNQKGKGPERKGYRVMARNMYTIHSVTFTCHFLFSFCTEPSFFPFLCFVLTHHYHRYRNNKKSWLCQIHSISTIFAFNCIE